MKARYLMLFRRVRGWVTVFILGLVRLSAGRNARLSRSLRKLINIQSPSL